MLADNRKAVGAPVLTLRRTTTSRNFMKFTTGKCRPVPGEK